MKKPYDKRMLDWNFFPGHHWIRFLWWQFTFIRLATYQPHTRKGFECMGWRIIITNR